MVGRTRNQPDYWDGNDRRGSQDRRDEFSTGQTQPSYFEQIILQNLQQLQQPQSTIFAPPAPVVVENITQSTLTLQQIAGIIIVLGSILVSGFSGWTALNKDLDNQKAAFSAFKDSIGKDVNGLEKNLIELRELNNEIKLDNKKTAESLEKRIQNLDQTVTQIYQKVSQK